MKPQPHCAKRWQQRRVISSLGLMMLLSGCSTPINPVQVEVITLLPETGLITQCNKPKLTGTTPAQTAADDVPRLKLALSKCAAQVQDYLTWYAEQAALLTK